MILIRNVINFSKEKKSLGEKNQENSRQKKYVRGIFDNFSYE